jgi:threonyl-tRNA synthetase
MPDENQPQPNQPPAQPNPERKTLDDRAKMNELERIRHSCAHVMATAVLRLWPDAQFAAWPPVENGFYYDVDLKHRISPADFPKIEEQMKKEIKANNVFEKIVVTREHAMKDSESGRLGGLSERPENPSKFKIGNLEAIPEGEPISYFKNGDFIDLCAGPHAMRTGNIGAFKFTTVAGACYKATIADTKIFLTRKFSLPTCSSKALMTAIEAGIVAGLECLAQ